MAISQPYIPKRAIDYFVSKGAPITGEQLFLLGGLGRTELVKGELIELMPTGHSHGYIESIITTTLMLYVRPNKLGRVLNGEAGVYTGRNPDTVRGVDVAYISNERFAQVQSESYLDVAPELIVEILSPSDAWSELQVKLAEYFAIDVKMVWVVDPALEQIHVFEALDQMHLLTLNDELTGGNVLPGFRTSVRAIFEE
ncbi:MAG: Uma2 family endonuclease [Caldilineaceae bacterium]